MSTTSAPAQSTELTLIPTSIVAKLINVFVSPSIVFDEVAASAPKTAHWLVPLILVCISSLVLVNITQSGERTAAVINQLLNDEKITAAQSTALSEHWESLSRVATCAGVVAGTFWSALVLWFINRLFLKGRVTFRKALEVAGLATTILILGAVITGLLIAATGDAAARPALSLLCAKLDPASPLRAAAGVLNIFQVWVVAVLAIGLSRLSGVSAKECGFWVFGYWIVVRLALGLLA
jgi:hypothetical protein